VQEKLREIMLFMRKEIEIIDNPSYVSAIWGTTGGGTTDTTVPAHQILTSTAKTTTSVTLAWNASTDNVGVTGYNVYVNVF
jgi:hypothetical protein